MGFGQDLELLGQVDFRNLFLYPLAEELHGRALVDVDKVNQPGDGLDVEAVGLAAVGASIQDVAQSEHDSEDQLKGVAVAQTEEGAVEHSDPREHKLLLVLVLEHVLPDSESVLHEGDIQEGDDVLFWLIPNCLLIRLVLLLELVLFVQTGPGVQEARDLVRLHVLHVEVLQPFLEDL